MDGKLLQDDDASKIDIKKEEEVFDSFVLTPVS
jgi:hypothetical protein